jgi:uncharacterized membrane protein (UPF0127 family)
MDTLPEMQNPHAVSSFGPVNRRRIAGILLLITAFATGCENEPVARDAYFPLEVGSVSLEAQLAIDSPTQSKGLMYRETLGENQGMLFISDRPRQQSYWMRNTTLPLDIGYFTEDGVLREVYPLFPRDETRVVSRRDDILYALEMNRGWFKSNGVLVGDLLNLELVNRARRALATAR